MDDVAPVLWLIVNRADRELGLFAIWAFRDLGMCVIGAVA
jgi:hypothetical protein